MAKKSIHQRNEEQRLRQSQMRRTAKELRRPSRDDLARMLLWQMINGLQQNKKTTNRQLELDNLCNMIVSGLVKQGFDEGQCEDVFDAIARKYASSQPPFRIKRHLQNDTYTNE
ncbi:MAG: hypothetical protein JJ858_18770 [Rhizobiaceae bacterium]|nr:hypothetical protein [Rhizobiaceae bacterium]